MIRLYFLCSSSQPGLSHAIKTLEDEYGVPLFQKEGRNVSLSRYGKELMKDVEEILDAYLRMEERAAGLRAEEKTVRIGTVYPLAAGTIPHMLRESYIAAAVPEGHPLEGKETITLKEAAKYPQVMFSRTSGFRSLQEQIFAEQGIQVKPVCEAEEIEVVTGLVENGFGISILPYMDIVRLHHITAIPVQTSSWKSKFYIARRKYGIRTAQEEAFFQHWKK